MDRGGRKRHGRSADGAQESGLVHVCSLGALVSTPAGE